MLNKDTVFDMGIKYVSRMHEKYYNTYHIDLRAITDTQRLRLTSTPENKLVESVSRIDKNIENLAISIKEFTEMSVKNEE